MLNVADIGAGIGIKRVSFYGNLLPFRRFLLVYVRKLLFYIQKFQALFFILRSLLIRLRLQKKYFLSDKNLFKN